MKTFSFRQKIALFRCYHGSLESSGDWVVIEKCLKPKIRTWASWIGFGNFILVTGGFASPKL